MRIALLVDESLPIGTRVHSKMIHDLAYEFQELGHKSIIITPGDPKQGTALVKDLVEGVEVWRFQSGYTRGVGLLRRVINEWLFSYKAWIAIENEVKTDTFDLCINYSPTIFFGPLTKRFRRRGTYVYLVLRDFFPQWIIDQGIISRWSPAAFFLKRYEKINYVMADCIGVMSKANLDVFCARFPLFQNVKILMNWTTTDSLPRLAGKIEIREANDLTGKIIFFYGGNLGYSNDMANLVRLAKNLI